MSKQNKKKSIDLKEVNDELIAKLHEIRDAAEGRRFSASRVYAAHNKVFMLKEEVQMCQSCVLARYKNLMVWLAEYEAENPQAKKTTGEKQFEPNVINFTAAQEGAQYGKATNSDGSFAAAGSYSSDGRTFLVNGEEGDYTELPADAIVIDFTSEEFKAQHIAQLNELGVTEDSTAEELIEALEVLKGGSDVSEELAAFYDAQIALANKVEPQYSDPSAAGFVEPAAGVMRVPMKDGSVVDFTPEAEGSMKGAAKFANGDKIKSGKHETATGSILVVQQTGKAAIKEPETLN